MEFRILGPLEVQKDGHLVPCRGAKLRLLLAALLLRPNEVISSDRLIEALWGDEPPPTAQKALQMHVSQLRRLLDPDVLITRPPGYELRVQRGELDLDDFEQAVTEARAATAERRTEDAANLLSTALALWRGPPFADLSFEEVLQPEIVRLEDLRLAAIEDRVDADLELGRHAALVPEIEALAAAHPLRERIQAQLMLALYRSGRQADALDVYAATRRRLVDELGLEPGRELQQLQQQVLAQDPALTPRPTTRDSAATEGLLGREREFSELAAAIDGAAHGRGVMVLVSGEPGIGKSRLADAVARHAEAAGAKVAVGRCWEAGGAPVFWPWLQALRTVLHDAELNALTDLADAEREESEAARFRMFESIGASLRAVAGETPIALFLDDIHAADPASLLLLRFIAAGLASEPIAIVGCYRDTEVGADLAATISELSRETVVRRVALKGLAVDATERLLAASMGEQPEALLVERVQAETRGNPLFAVELGRLFASEGVPASGSGRLPVPQGVRDAIARRVERRSQACRELLAAASVIGREFDVRLLSAVTRLAVDELTPALDEAEAARLIGAVPGTSGRLRFAHILVRDALYDELPGAERARTHRDVADALVDLRSSNPGPHLAEIAYHYVTAGPEAGDAAIDYSLRAAAHAESQHGYEDAARHLATALELLRESGTADQKQECDVLLSLGAALSRAGRSAEAKETLRDAAASAEANGWPDRLARAALGYGGRFAWARGSTDPALVPLLQRGLEAIGETDRAIRARLLARLAAARRDEPLRDGRLALAREAVAIADNTDDLITRAYALEGYWIAAETADGLVEGIAVGDELVELGNRIGDTEHQFTGRDFKLNVFWKLADRAGVDVELEALTQIAEELRQPAWRWWVRTTRTAMTLMEGDFVEAERLIEDTRRFGEEAERFNAHVSERLQLFVLRRAQGRLAELEPIIARSVHEYPSLLRFAAAHAHLLGEIGDERSARAAFDAVMAHDLAVEYVDGEWLFTVVLLADPCRGLADEDAAARLYALLTPFARTYAQAPVEASFGSAARALGVLATVLGKYADAERHFEDAIAIERRMRARPWVAQAQLDLASMLFSTGDRVRADPLLAEAAASYDALGMPTWAERARRAGVVADA